MPKPTLKPLSKAKMQLTFGASVRALRQDREITQQTLAELADLHTNYVSSVERGERNLSLHNISKLAAALGVPASRLISCIDI